VSPRLTVLPMPAVGTEDVLVAPDGADEGCVYTGTEDGALWRMSHDGARVERVAETGGRPLGIERYPDGRLLVCDAYRGLLLVDPRTGALEVAADRAGGRRMLLVDNAAVAADGTVWFSDSSTRYQLDRWKDDFVQDTRTGRLLRWTPGAAEAEPVLDGLAFANGVALGEHWVAVAETAARRVVRLWLSGELAGTQEELVADLPGYPDNIALGTDGLLWVTIASPADPVVERLMRAPGWVRRAVTKVPDAVQPQPKQTVRVQAYDPADRPGRLVHDLDLTDRRREVPFHFVTGVREHDGTVWLGSLSQPAIAALTW
jgi:sugar lactone lactonase YvrE